MGSDVARWKVTLFAKVSLQMEVEAESPSAAIDQAYDELALQDPEKLRMTIVGWMDEEKVSKQSLPGGRETKDALH